MLKLPSFEKCPRAVAVDLDGTLFNSNSELSAISERAIFKVVEAGIPFIVATARPERSVRQKLGEQLASKCTMITMHGSISRMAAPFRGVRKRMLPPLSAAEIVEMAERGCPQAHIVIEMEGFEYARNRVMEQDGLVNPNFQSEAGIITVDEALKGLPGAVFIVDFNSDMSELAANLQQRLGGKLEIIKSNRNHVLSVVNKGVSKKNSLKWLLEENRISPDEVMAFGDDLPDIEMLEICGFSIAMANAAPEVKAASLYQTLSNDENGVAVVLERMLEAK